ncbi:MAG TPA: glycosyltransferase family 39 protein [Acidimicrobiales bacterium]
MPTPAQGSRIAERILVALCVVGGGVARFVPSTPLWLDEALTVNIAAAPLGDIHDLLRHDGHPPAFYWLLHVWIDLFGDGATAVRALSGVLGLVAIGLTYLVARRLAGPVLATLAAAVIATSPYAIRYSSEARMYELVVVLVLAGWLLLDRALAPALAHDRLVDTAAGDPRRARGTPSPLVLVGLAVVSGALLLTHYWGMFLLAAVLIVLGIGAWRARGPARRATVSAAVALAVGALAFVPWLPTMRYQSEHTGTPWAPPPRPTRVLSESIADFTGGLWPESTVLVCVLAVLVTFAVFAQRERAGLVVGWLVSDWRRPVIAVTALTMAIGAVAALATDSAYAGRYASVFFPLVVVLTAAGLALVAPGWPRVALLALIALLAAVIVAGNAFRRDRTQAGEVAAAIVAEAQPGDLVVVCPDQLGPALARLVDVDGVRVVRYPDLGDPRFVDWVDYLERHEGVDVAAVADRIVAEAGTGSIWLEWSDGYRVVGEQCRELVAHLTLRRPLVDQPVSADNVEFFEYASLHRFRPARP